MPVLVGYALTTGAVVGAVVAFSQSPLFGYVQDVFTSVAASL